MSLAERTREAAQAHPFLLAGLGAGIVNYTAAARFLDVEGDVDAVSTALRRYAADLDPIQRPERDVRVTMHRGVGTGANDEAAGGEPLLAIDGVRIAEDAGSDTAILATGEVRPRALAHVLDRLLIDDVEPRSAGVGNDALVVVVDRRDGADALRIVEGALTAGSTE